MSTGALLMSRGERRHPTLLQNRWIVAAAGTIMMMCLGTVYSWSLYARPLMAAFHWSVMTTMWAFSIAIFSLGIGAVVGGRAQDRVGPRTIAAAGVCLWALGNLLAGMFTAELGVWWLYLTYGAIGGFGLGMGYVSPVAMVTKWFPDHRGAAGGLVVTGFGLGAFFYNAIVPRFAGFAQAAADASAAIHHHAAMTQADLHAVMTAFTWSGVTFLALGGACALLLRNPPEGYGRRVDDPVVADDGTTALGDGAHAAVLSVVADAVLQRHGRDSGDQQCHSGVQRPHGIEPGVRRDDRRAAGDLQRDRTDRLGRRVGPHRAQSRLRAHPRRAGSDVRGDACASQRAAGGARLWYGAALQRRQLRHDAGLQRGLLRDEVHRTQLRAASSRPGAAPASPARCSPRT